MEADSKKYFYTYEESNEQGAGSQALFQKILEDPKLPLIKHLTVGYWGECYEDNPQPIIDGIIMHKKQFAHLESLFIGDMEYDECEVSWITQGDYSGLFAALPGLKSLKIKGSEDLVIGKGVSHDHLEELQIICGGLDASVIQDIAAAKLPALSSLILYLGVEDYGMNIKMEDLKALLQKESFPSLKYLGLVDSEIQDEVVKLILSSDILSQLEGLDLSYGTLTDEGGQTLLDCRDKLGHLKKLKISYHYMSDAMVSKLNGLPFQTCIDDQQDFEEDEDYRWPLLTE